MKRFLVGASNWLLIIGAPLWIGFYAWYIFLKEGVDEDILSGKVSFFSEDK